MNIPSGLTPGQKLTAQREGGIVNEAYKDKLGNWTVGIGCTGPEIVAGTVWTDQQATAEFLRRYGIASAQAQLDLGVQYWASLDDVRRAGLADIAYQDGGGNASTGVGGLAGYHRMLAAGRVKDWPTMSAECRDSLNEVQTPDRCNSNAAMFLTGDWPAA